MEKLISGWRCERGHIIGVSQEILECPCGSKNLKFFQGLVGSLVRLGAAYTTAVDRDCSEDESDARSIVVPYFENPEEPVT